VNRLVDVAHRPRRQATGAAVEAATGQQLGVQAIQVRRTERLELAATEHRQDMALQVAGVLGRGALVAGGPHVGQPAVGEGGHRHPGCVHADVLVAAVEFGAQGCLGVALAVEA
jgi:hypothetical protein